MVQNGWVVVVVVSRRLFPADRPGRDKVRPENNACHRAGVYLDIPLSDAFNMEENAVWL